MTRDLCLSKESAQLLGPLVKENHLLASETTFYWCILVLLHNGNKVAFILVGHSVQTLESYSNLELLLRNLKYEDHDWMICGDLKVIALVLGLQGGYTKYPCVLCLWDSRQTSKTTYSVTGQQDLI